MPSFVTPASGGRRTREFNDCNLPGGASDGGQFGANADPRCAGGTGSLHYGPVRPPRGKALARFNDQQAASAAAQRAEDALTAKYGPPLMSRKPEPPPAANELLPGVHRDVFTHLSEEQRQKLLKWSFPAQGAVRESLVVTDAQTGTPLHAHQFLQSGGGIDAFIGAVRSSDLYGTLIGGGDEKPLSDEELWTRTQQAADDGVLLGVKNSVPASEAVMRAGVTFHTHPSSGTFSSTDINTFATYGPGMGGVVGRLGDEYAVRIKARDIVVAQTAHIAKNMAPIDRLTRLLVTGKDDASIGAMLDARRIAQAAGFSMDDVHQWVYSRAWTGAYQAMHDVGWLEYGEKRSAAGRAKDKRMEALLGVTAESISEAHRTALKQAGPIHFRFQRDLVDVVFAGRSKGTGRDVSGATQEAALTEFNACHEPAGRSTGGRFCSGPGEGDIAGEWTKTQRAYKSRRATTGPMRPATTGERKRYKVPPSFVDAMVSTDPKSEVRATAVSPTTGKKRAFYSASYTDRQALAKWSRIAGVHRLMPKITARVGKDSESATSPDQQPAMALRLILQTGMRNGAENENDTYGATSLRSEHATVTGEAVRLDFAGKDGVAQSYLVKDSAFARYVQSRQQAGAETLFDIGDEDTLDYMKRVAGSQYKVHDVRTWYGTVFADQIVTKLVADGLRPTTPKEQKAFQKQVAKKVAEALGNTPAVTLRNYIHPFIWKAVE